MITKKTKKLQEELPRFLLNLNRVPSDLNLPTKDTPSEHYLGPLFFGGCWQHHPPHIIPRERLPPAIFTTVSEQDILENVFVEPSTHKKASKPVTQKWRLVKERKTFEPPVFQHRGVRKVFVPEVDVREIDFGETESEITGETCREIPVCRVTSNLSFSEQYEMVNLSDISERNRPFMTYNERIAHSHFLKEFVTVKIIGPKIPAAITIKKLPTKRKRLSDFNIHLQTNEKKKVKEEKVPEEDVKEKTVEEEKDKKEEDKGSIKELMKPVSKAEVLEDTLDYNENRETSTTTVNEENEESHEESIAEQEDEGSVGDYDEEDGKSLHSGEQDLEQNSEAEEQLELEVKEKEEEEEGDGNVLENEKPNEEEKVLEGKGSKEEVET